MDGVPKREDDGNRPREIVIIKRFKDVLSHFVAAHHSLENYNG